MALQKLGVTMAAVDPDSSPSELSSTLADSEAETVFCTDTNFGYLWRLRQSLPVKRLIVTTLTELLPFWKRALSTALDMAPQGRYAENSQSFRFGSLLEGVTGHKLGGTVSQDQVSVLAFTSGTTALPKPIPLTHAFLLETMSAWTQALTGEARSADGTTLQARPLYECLGLVTALSVLTLAGETLLLAPSENLDAYLAMAERYTATCLLGSPELYRRLLANPRLGDYDLRSLRTCVSGGDFLPSGTAEAWQKRLGRPLYQIYCATEACGPITVPSRDQAAPTATAGKVDPHKKVKVVSPNTANEVSAGTPGEILVSSPHMSGAYWKRPEETRVSFVEVNGERWFRTGDIGCVDKGGWFMFHSRRTDILRRAGGQIPAAEIERAMERHPAVLHAAVIGMPEAGGNDRMRCFLVLTPGVKGISNRQIAEWCRENLGEHLAPEYIEVRDVLPFSKAGKLLKRELIVEEG
jgi:long-chain acyl-CoA synthetase